MKYNPAFAQYITAQITYTSSDAELKLTPTPGGQAPSGNANSGSAGSGAGGSGSGGSGSGGSGSGSSGSGGSGSGGSGNSGHSGSANGSQGSGGSDVNQSSGSGAEESAVVPQSSVVVPLHSDPSAQMPPLFVGGQQAADMQSAILSGAAGIGEAVLSGGCDTVHSDGFCQSRGRRFEAWVNPLFDVGGGNGNGETLSYNDGFSGVAAGGGIFLGRFTVGLGGGYLSSSVKFSGGGEATGGDGFGFLYGRHDDGRLRIAVVAGYGAGTIAGSRFIPGTGLSAQSNRGDRFGFVSTHAAYDIPMRVWKQAVVVQPRLTLNVLYAHQDGFSEHGAGILDLNYEALDNTEVNGRASARIIKSFEVGRKRLSAWLQLGVQQIFSGASRLANVADGLYSAAVPGVTQSLTAALVGAGVKVASVHGVEGYVSYQGLYSGNGTDNRFLLGVKCRL